MAIVKTDDQHYKSIADAIRAKTGSSVAYTPAQMTAAIGELSTAETIQHTEIPDYVKEAALTVATKAAAVRKSDSILFLAGSDAHQSTTAHVAEGNLHGGMAMKALAYALPLDFACFLGDYTAGSSTTTLEEGRGHFKQINADIDEAFQGLPQFRTVGNHDPLGYSYSQNGVALTPAELYSYIGKYNAEGGNVMGSTTAGYCYRDFPGKKLRVICLNTADQDRYTGSGEAVSTEQKLWFADTLISTPSGYGILILSHHPLDWGNIMSVSHILRAYVEQQASINVGGTVYSFTGKNKSAWALQIHGHTHCFTVDNLHWNNGGTGTAYDVKRVAVPNMCFVRNNEYGSNSASEYYGIEFGEPGATYAKTAGTAGDTALCLFVLNPSEEKLYAFCYGAGYDREVFFGETAVAVTGVTLSAAGRTLNPGGAVTLTAAVAPADASDKTVAWSSSNTAVATVANGVVTAVGVGSCVITVTTNDGGFTASYALTVERAKQGNLISKVGYVDNTRVKSSGEEAADSGIVAVGYISFDDMDYPAVVRIKGAEWRTATVWQANHICFPASKTSGVEGNNVYGGNGSTQLKNVGCMLSVSADGQTLEFSIPKRPAANYQYLRINGKGSGANLDLRINEDFD